MPGTFGTQPTDDGVTASTDSSAHSGVFGRNDATDPPPAGSAGGAGVFGLSVSPGAAGVFGANNDPAKGSGVQGNGPEAGVSGFSESGAGVLAHSNSGDGGRLFAHNPGANGVLAMNDSTDDAPSGGAAPAGNGILATTKVGGAAGVFGASNHPTKGSGVQGNGPEAGVSGFSESGTGVLGHSNKGDGAQLFAHDPARNGVLGHNNGKGKAPTKGAPAGNGVYGYTEVSNASGVCGAVAAGNSGGAGVTGIGKVAGRFLGNVAITGSLTVNGDILLAGADYAEEFDVDDEDGGVVEASPGTVMVLSNDGSVRPAGTANDRRVVGVVSGGGRFRPGVILDHQVNGRRRCAIALTGKVLCKVDADLGAVAVGDLLTTSSTTGYAMRTSSIETSFGALIGKAMEPLDRGRGLVPILVSRG